MNPRLAAAVCLTAAVVLFACDPASAAIYPICPFHWLTGLYCPVCGSIRGAHALLHGHVLEAMRCNVLTLGTVVYAAAIATPRPGAAPSPVLPRSPHARAAVYAAIVVGFTVVRNVPGAVGALFRP